MVTETGIIEQVEGHWAWVVTQRIYLCAHLSLKKNRQTISSEDSIMIKVRNLTGAMPGDEVELYIKTDTKYKLIFLLYILPAIGLLVGAFSADLLSQFLRLSPVIGSFIFPIAGFALTHNFVRLALTHLTPNTNLTPVVGCVMLRSTPFVTTNMKSLLNQGIGREWCIPSWIEKEMSSRKHSSIVRPDASQQG